MVFFTPIANIASAEAAQSAETGADLLASVLSSDALFWGCIAAGLIALFTVGRVTRKRRAERGAGRKMRARTKAVHEFLETVRSERLSVLKGVWHYDFGTGAKQMSDDLKRLLLGDAGPILADEAIEDLLKEAGLDLERTAREHRAQNEPYTIEFAIEASDGGKRAMVLQACNIFGQDEKAQRMVAIMREAVRE